MVAKVESLLAACGRDLVLERSGGKPAIAIRWSPDTPGLPTETKWCYAEGATAEEAALKAASAFALRLQRLGTALLDWGSKIAAEARRLAEEKK